MTDHPIHDPCPHPVDDVAAARAAGYAEGVLAVLAALEVEVLTRSVTAAQAAGFLRAQNIARGVGREHAGSAE